MKTAIVLLLAAIAAFLYFKPVAEKIEAPRVVASVATGRERSVVVVPVTEGKMSGRWKTGPNAQTNLSLNIDRLKTGPNAQTDLMPTIDRLKTGPNAQTDLTLKRSW
jgi:hypothetical protein